MTCVLNIPMYFRFSAESIKDNVMMNKIRDVGKLCLGESVDGPTEVVMGTTVMLLFHTRNDSHVIVVVYGDGLVTLDIQVRVSDDKRASYGSSYVTSVENKLFAHFGTSCVEHRSLPCPVRRGHTIWPYALSADDRLLHLDHDDLLFEKNSRYQNIRIVHTTTAGNALFLDGEAMLGEGDDIYTRTLCRIGEENFTDKTVLILGGGDGGILHELRKENVGFVTIAEIDEEVISACRKYLRGACGDSLDKMSGPNYQILVDDCIKVLQKNVADGVKYDFVINDLTEFPVDSTQRSRNFDVSTRDLVMKLSLAVLKQNGKIFARGNCVNATAYRRQFEDFISELGLKFNRRDVFVPSFHEVYCLYEITRAGNVDNVANSGESCG